MGDGVLGHHGRQHDANIADISVHKLELTSTICLADMLRCCESVGPVDEVAEKKSKRPILAWLRGFIPVRPTRMNDINGYSAPTESRGLKLR